MSDRIWTASNNHGTDKRGHTDPDCPRLSDSDPKDHPRESLPDIEICQWCSGEFEAGTDGCTGLWQDLDKMDSDEVGV